MCGIVGYVGPREGPPIVLSGLRRLEYRGYDSAGLATLENRRGKLAIGVRRAQGRIENLLKILNREPLKGNISIGHTRWATHGKPSERNAHPHRYRDVVIVHNGIIENFGVLTHELKKHGNTFTSETDSEVIAHVIQYYLDETENFEQAVLKAVNRE